MFGSIYSKIIDLLPERIKEGLKSEGFKKYFKNTGWIFIGRVFVLVVAFFVNAYIARYLGPSKYGLLNYVFSFVGLFGFIASLGMESIVNREIIKNHGDKNKILGTSFCLKFFASLFAVILIFVISLLTTDDTLLIVLISMYSLTFIFSAFNIVDVYFQSQVLSKYATIVTIVSGIISAILKIIVMCVGAGIVWLMAVYVLDSIIISIGLFYFFVRKSNSISEWVFDKGVAILILKDSWPLMLSSVAWSVYMKIDQVMIKNMLGNEQVGIYAVAVKLSEFWYFIPSSICASVFPAIMNAKKTSKELYEKRLGKLYFLVFWLSLGIAILTTVFAYFIINMLFGSQYLEAVTTLRIYVWAGISVSMGSVLWYYLIAEGLTKLNAIMTAVGAVSNVVLNFFLIPRYGINGAAFASLFSYTAVTFSILFFKGAKSQIKVIINSIFPLINR